MLPQGVLLTGTFGAGKSSALEEMAESLEAAERSYALIDLDYLMWFDVDVDDDTRQQIFLTNVASVVGNYLDAGVQRFLMALAIRNAEELEALRQAVPVPFRVVRLCVPLAQIETRLSSDVTVGRQKDLHNAAEWIARSVGVGLEDTVVSNNRAIADTAAEILQWMGWLN